MDLIQNSTFEHCQKFSQIFFSFNKMKLVSYTKENKEALGLVCDGKLYNASAAAQYFGFVNFPGTMALLLKSGMTQMKVLKEVDVLLKTNPGMVENLVVSDAQLLAPVPHPNSLRDAYAFRNHVAVARKNRNQELLPEFDQFPVFYFSNHNAVFGPGEVYCMPDHFKELDFELEVAVVIGEEVIDLNAVDAETCIAGYLIMNDLSARTLQREEMLFHLGPAKGKDFATLTGPWLVTPDELEPYRVKTKTGHTGAQYNLKMQCWVNGLQVSEGNFADMDWTFAEIIERCSYGVRLFPGDIIGSGTVGTGCFLELNGTGLRKDPDYQVQWLVPGDVIEMEVTGLGRLKNTIKSAGGNHSILALKKS
jgi:fumarylacetoacetate (FAA) hydrolase